MWAFSAATAGRATHKPSPGGSAMLLKKYVHHRRLQQPDQTLFGKVQAEDKALFKITAHDGNISEITFFEMGQLAKNSICLTIPHENIKEIKIKKHQRKTFSVFKYGLNYLNNSLLNPNNMLNINYLQFLSCT